MKSDQTAMTAAESLREEKEMLQEVVDREYKWGFTTDVESDTVPPGLNEGVIRFISQKKNEPAWLLDYRLKAYAHFLTLTPPKKTMITEAAAAGQFEMEGFHAVPRIQIVTIEEALELRDRAVRLPARRDDTFKKAAREEDTRAQGKLDI